jgi:hypothetical protein
VPALALYIKDKAYMEAGKRKARARQGGRPESTFVEVLISGFVIQPFVI